MYKGEFNVAIDFRGNYGKAKNRDVVSFIITSEDRDPEFLLPGKVKQYCIDHYGEGTVDWGYEGTITYPDGCSWYVDSGESGCGDDICAVTTRVVLDSCDCNEVFF